MRTGPKKSRAQTFPIQTKCPDSLVVPADQHTDGRGFRLTAHRFVASAVVCAGDSCLVNTARIRGHAWPAPHHSRTPPALPMMRDSLHINFFMSPVIEETLLRDTRINKYLFAASLHIRPILTFARAVWARTRAPFHRLSSQMRNLSQDLAIGHQAFRCYAG